MSSPQITLVRILCSLPRFAYKSLRIIIVSKHLLIILTSVREPCNHQGASYGSWFPFLSVSLNVLAKQVFAAH